MAEENLYLKNNLEGMNNDELILFVYQELIKVLQQARYYFELNDIEKRVVAINKAIEVISTLLGILDYSAGQVAFQLRSLYMYAMQELTKANYDRKPELVDGVIRIFRTLHDTWKEKIESDRKNMVANRADSVHNVPQGDRNNIEIYG